MELKLTCHGHSHKPCMYTYYYIKKANDDDAKSKNTIAMTSPFSIDYSFILFTTHMLARAQPCISQSNKDLLRRSLLILSHFTKCIRVHICVRCTYTSAKCKSNKRMLCYIVHFGCHWHKRFKHFLPMDECNACSNGHTMNGCMLRTTHTLHISKMTKSKERVM